jgi:hypothetical protein
MVGGTAVVASPQAHRVTQFVWNSLSSQSLILDNPRIIVGRASEVHLSNSRGAYA